MFGLEGEGAGEVMACPYIPTPGVGRTMTKREREKNKSRSSFPPISPYLSAPSNACPSVNGQSATSHASWRRS